MDHDAHKHILFALVASYPCKNRFNLLRKPRFVLKIIKHVGSFVKYFRLVSFSSFGDIGANMLIYTFPILFIATLGCLYLHLGKKYVDCDAEGYGVLLFYVVDFFFSFPSHLINQRSFVLRNVENSGLASWKRPVLVNGPLGIVSWTELPFLTMFIAMLVWSFSSYLHGMFAIVTQQAVHEGEHL